MRTARRRTRTLWGHGRDHAGHMTRGTPGMSSASGERETVRQGNFKSKVGSDSKFKQCYSLRGSTSTREVVSILFF